MHVIRADHELAAAQQPLDGAAVAETAAMSD